MLPEGSGTRLTYKATASVGGKLAQIGSRLIDGVAKKMSDDFFARFNATVAPAPADAIEPAPTHGRDLRWVWVAGSIVLLLFILFLIRRA